MPVRTKLYFVRVVQNFKSAATPPASAIKLLPAILQGIANPVEPFSFKFFQNHLPLSLLDGVRDGLGKLAGLFEQFHDREANGFDRFHDGFLAAPVERLLSRR
jgi:hypothetical protein